jgi:hypothetical protein
VAELREHLRFALEQLERFPGPAWREPFDDDLGRVGALGLRIRGEKELALRSLAERLAEPKPPSSGPGSALAMAVA